MFDFLARKAMILLKTHIFKWVLGVFWVGNSKTHIFKWVFGVFWVLDPPEKISMSRIRNFEIAKLTIQFFVWGVQNPKNPKNPFKYAYF